MKQEFSMTPLEEDFVDFISETRGEDRMAVLKRYEASRRTIDFGSKEFNAHENITYNLLQVFFDDQSDESLFKAYQYYAYSDLLRMLSYSFSKPKTARGYLKTLWKILKRGDWQKIQDFIDRKTAKVELSPADILLEGYAAPTILDYGCGTGYRSFELAQKNPAVQVILLDLDTIKLDFAEFRFKKYAINHRVIRLGTENQYPTSLPAHDICIAMDVLEHLRFPLVAYGHIKDAMNPGGKLYGNFDDIEYEMYHVHPDLSDVRAVVAKDFEKIAPNIYKKL